MAKIKIEIKDLAEFIWDRATDVEYIRNKELNNATAKIETLETSIRELKKSIALLQKQNDAQRGVIERSPIYSHITQE